MRLTDGALGPEPLVQVAQSGVPRLPLPLGVCRAETPKDSAQGLLGLNHREKGGGAAERGAGARGPADKERGWAEQAAQVSVTFS